MVNRAREHRRDYREGDALPRFPPTRRLSPPGPDAHVLLPEKTLPRMEDAVGVPMDAIVETIAQDESLASL